MWNWAAWLQGSLPPEKRMVRLNLDETSVSLLPGSGKGYMVPEAVKLARLRRGLTRSVTRGELRTNFMHVALLADDEGVQSILPQLLIVREDLVSLTKAQEIRSSLPRNVHLLRSKKAWASTAALLLLVRLLKEVLRPLRSSCDFVLSADTYRAHLTKPFLMALGRARIKYMLIPAKMTWCLQPLDMHVFAQYKAALWKAHQTRACRSESGRPTWEMVIASIVEVIETVLRGKSWSQAFRDVGLTGDVKTVSQTTQKKLGLLEMPEVQSTFPTLQELTEIFPRRSIIPIAQLFSFWAAGPQESRSQHVSIRADAPGVEKKKWQIRTRSMSAQQLDPEPSVSSSSWIPTPSPMPSLPPSGFQRLPTARRLRLPADLGAPPATQ